MADGVSGTILLSEEALGGLCLWDWLLPKGLF